MHDNIDSPNLTNKRKLAELPETQNTGQSSFTGPLVPKLGFFVTLAVLQRNIE